MGVRHSPPQRPQPNDFYTAGDGSVPRSWRWALLLIVLAIVALVLAAGWAGPLHTARRAAAEARCDRMIEAYPADPGDEDVEEIARVQCTALWTRIGAWEPFPDSYTQSVREDCEAGSWRNFGPNRDVGMTRCVYVQDN